MSAETTPRILAVVPARFASARFPGKIIADLEGKPLVLHAYERAMQAKLVSEVILAIDDERVADAIAPYDVPFVMTKPDHVSGTDRIAEVAAQRNETILVNVQGDEVLIDPDTIDATIQPLLDQEDVVMSTARHALTDPDMIRDPNVVKVVCDQRGLALYFSRAPIPHVRDGNAPQGVHWQHIGLYVYRRDFLLHYSELAQTPLEILEKLEQLRAIENGYKIAVVDTEYEGIGVDVPADLEWVRTLVESSRKEQGNK